MNQSFTVTFSLPSSDSSSDQVLMIEQESWEAFVGSLTAANMVRYIRNLLFGTDDQEPYIDCGVDEEGCVVTVINVYELYPSVSYRLYASHGVLGVNMVTDFEEEEIVKFGNADSTSTRYPARRIVDREWMGQVYDSNDQPIADPPITIDGKDLILPQPIYGTVKLKYMVHRHSYGLRITPREDEVEGAFSAAVYAVYDSGENYDGGIEHHMLSNPPGIDSIAFGDQCGRGGGVYVDVADDDPPQLPNGEVNKYTEIEYCTQLPYEYQSPYWRGST